jgi:hypothetical protein
MLSRTQTEVLGKMRNGWLAIIHVDSRICGSRIYEKGWSYLGEHVHGNTLLALLNRNLIRVVRTDGQSTVYEAV